MTDSSLNTPVAIIGAKGFVGKCLAEKLAGQSTRVLTTTRGRTGDSLALDLTAPNLAVIDRMAKEGCKTGIICAAISNIATCENDPEETHKINVTGTLAVARAMQASGILPVFLSSDAVFSGNDAKPYEEDSPTGPINEYGRQKTEVEEGIIAQGPALVLRLTKLYGMQKGDNTLLDSLAATLLRGDTLRAARDLYFHPTFVEDAIAGILLAVARRLQGIFHLCSPLTVNRLELVQALASELNCPRERVTEISLGDITGARLPKNLSMRQSKVFGSLDFMPMETATTTITTAYRKDSL